MKKSILIILVSACFFIQSNAQEQVKFLGCSLNNKLYAVVDSLVTKGYNVQFNNKKTKASLSGDYANLTNVQIEINATPISNFVYSIIVSKNSNLGKLEFSYTSLLERFEKKYGELSPSKKSLADFSLTGSGIAYFDLVDENNVKYGYIMIHYSKSSEKGTDELTIIFVDIKNNQLNSEEKEKSIDNDI